MGGDAQDVALASATERHLEFADSVDGIEGVKEIV
jgi:hypothetical protein